SATRREQPQPGLAALPSWLQLRLPPPASKARSLRLLSVVFPPNFKPTSSCAAKVLTFATGVLVGSLCLSAGAGWGQTGKFGAPKRLPAMRTVPPIRRPELLLRPENSGCLVLDPRDRAEYRLGVHEAFLLSRLDGQHTCDNIRQTFDARFGEPLAAEEL